MRNTRIPTSILRHGVETYYLRNDVSVSIIFCRSTRHTYRYTCSPEHNKGYRTNGDRSSRLRRIGNTAFYGCTALQRIVQGLLPGVLQIERGAFFDCAQLGGALVIPHTTLFLGEGCFARCASLRRVVFEAASCSSSSTTTRTVRIENSVFGGCTALRAIRLPHTLTAIRRYCFYKCHALITIAIPTTVTRIERRAFVECTSLCALELPENVVELADDAYRGCSSVVSVTIRAKSLIKSNSGTISF